MEVDYKFVPEYDSLTEKRKSDIISYAGKLLEIVSEQTLIVGIDNDNKPYVLEINGRLRNALDFEFYTY